MPSVVQESVTYGGDLSHKDRSTEPNFVSGISGFTPKLIEPTVVPVVSGFTAVNGRSSTSPPSDPARANGSLDVRPSSEIRLSPINDQKRGFSVQHQGPWHYTTGDHSRRMTSPIQNGDKSASTSPITSKRKRDTSDESSGSSLSPVLEGTDEEGHRLKRLNGYSPIRGQSSPAMSTHGLPNTVSNPAAQPARSDYSPPTERKESIPLLRGPSESAPSDGRLSEVLQREGQDVNQARQVGEPRSGDEHMASSGHHLETFSGEGPRPLLQGDPKKRKRQFANRTKTGCQTCRRRKKKCDEGKPECANCRRGGFLCEGYLAKTPYKPSVARGPVQIQSKDGYGEQHPHPAHPQHLAQPHHQPQLYHRHGPPRDSSSIPDTNSQHADGARARPIVVDDNERQTPRSTWPSWNDSSIRPYAQHPPPSTDYPPPPRTISQPYADHPAPAPLAQRPPPPAPYSHTSTSNPTIATAQLALQHQSTAVHAPPPPPPVSYSSSRQPQSEKSEKEKMLAGEHYKWRAPELVEEREQCKVHLWRFNNAAQNPTMGVSREERTRLFRTILEAPHVVRHNKDTPVGSVGKDVMVEAPFMCDYGYNINIGDGVVIGSGCTVMDPCKIMIGPRTVIGPNCNIYGLDMPKDPLVRQGGLEATAYGKDIVIEEDVFIGGNVTILPGVRIGRGATIGAGSIVTKDIAPHTVWACKQHGRLDQLQVLWNANR